jgi:hypothetical protein
VFVGTENGISGGGRGRSGGGGGRDRDDEGGGDRDLTDPVQVSLRPGNTQAVVGDRVSIDITASGSGSLNNAGMRVNWNPQVLRLDAVNEGGLLSSDGARTSFTSNQAAQGTAALGVGRVGSVGGVAPNGVLATLEFEVIGAGTAAVQVVSAALRDEQGRPMAVDFDQAEVVAEQ